jgi:AcrR family transcriptional regulator
MPYRPGMPSSTSIGEPASSTLSARDAQRLETRARLFDAAVTEIGRSGLAGADVSTIAAAAGVARGTFYFHFPTKEHVVVEVERAEEAKIVDRLGTRQSEPTDLLSMLSLLVREVLAAERRLGPVFFRDMLRLHFSSTRPVEDELSEHPLAEFVVAAIAQAQAAGRVTPDADAGELGVFFLTGLFALLSTNASAPKARAALMGRYAKTIVQGMEAR